MVIERTPKASVYFATFIEFIYSVICLWSKFMSLFLLFSKRSSSACTCRASLYLFIMKIVHEVQETKKVQKGAKC